MSTTTSTIPTSARSTRTRAARILVAVLRLLMAAAILTALITQLITSVQFANKGGGDYAGNVLTNFFSYFTVDSNLLSAVLLLIGCVVLVAHAGPEPRWFALARVSVVTYMVITGIVYNLLLRDALPGAVVAWSNEVLHVIGPIFLLLDWLFAPGRRRMPVRDMWLVVAFPILWLVYTLIRGPFGSDAITHTSPWYPYPFLNPVTAQNGYFTVAVYVVLIAAVFCLVAAGLLWLSRRGRAVDDTVDDPIPTS